MHTSRQSLSVDIQGLPTEFRLFTRGENQTQQGTFIFDDTAAAMVMAQYQAHGVDRMIDLEHTSLDETSPAYDPDARGWCQLALRNGELWAVNVRWTPDGAARLRNRTQRYVSPTFEFDSATGRVKSIFNIALTAMPATNGTPALMAASVRRQANHGLDARELRICKEAGCSPEAFASLKHRQRLARLSSPVPRAIADELGLKPDATMSDAIEVVKKLVELNPRSELNDPAPKELIAELELGPMATVNIVVSRIRELRKATEKPSEEQTNMATASRKLGNVSAAALARMGGK